MAPKRKLDFVDGDDEKLPTPGNRVLPVANLPTDFDGEPEDGAQYLFLVRRDALNLPQTTRAENPWVLDASSIPATRKPCHPCIPSEEWRTSFEETFRNFRQSWRASKNAPEKFDKQAHGVPRPRDRDGWLQFLNGSTTSPKKASASTYPPSTAFTPRSVVAARFSVPMAPQNQMHTPTRSRIQQAGIIDDEPDIPAVEENDGKARQSEPRGPIPSIIKNMDDNGVIYLTMFIAHWIRKSLENIAYTTPTQPLTRPFYFPRHHQQWAFALLAQLDGSLISEEISHLREVARACIDAIRADLELDGLAEIEVDTDVSIIGNDKTGAIAPEPDPARYAHLIGVWMVIGAIASIWGQRDMWEHAEDTLSDLVTVKPRPLAPKVATSAARPASPSQAVPPHRPDPVLDVVLDYG